MTLELEIEEDAIDFDDDGIRGDSVSGVVAIDGDTDSDVTTGGGTEAVLPEMAGSWPIAPRGGLESRASTFQSIGRYYWLAHGRVPSVAWGFIALGSFLFLVYAALGGTAVGLLIGFAVSAAMATMGTAGTIYLTRVKIYPRLPDHKTAVAWKAERNQILKRRKKRDRLIKKEAKRVAKEVKNNLARIGFSRLDQSSGAIKYDVKIRYDAIVCTRDSIGLKISSRTPYRVRFADMAQNEIADEMSTRLQRGCWWEGWRDSYENGLWMFVALGTGTQGISKTFLWDHDTDPFTALQELPTTKKYAFSIGVTKGRKVLHTTLPDLPHLGIFGSTDSGKSVFLNQLLCTLIMRHSPRELGLVLIDMKKVELSQYDGIPHLVHERISDVHDVLKPIEWLKNEMEKRYRVMEGDSRNISEWNQKHPQRRFKRLLLVIDEWAAVMLSKELNVKDRNAIESTLTRVVQESRAVGIHVILTTQSPRRKIMEGLLMDNIPNRVVFQMGDIRASMIALDTSESAYIPDQPGRGIYKSGPRKTEFKGPLINLDQVQAVVRQCRGMEADPIPEVDPYDIVEFALKMGSRLHADFRRFAAHEFGMGITALTNLLPGLDYDTIKREPVWFIAGREYIVYPFPSRRGGRVVFPVDNGHRPENEKELEAAWKAHEATLSIMEDD